MWSDTKHLFLISALGFSMTFFTGWLWNLTFPIGPLDGDMLNSLKYYFLDPVATIGEIVGVIALIIGIVRWRK